MRPAPLWSLWAHLDTTLLPLTDGFTAGLDCWLLPKQPIHSTFQAYESSQQGATFTVNSNMKDVVSVLASSSSGQARALAITCMVLGSVGCSPCFLFGFPWHLRAAAPAPIELARV